MQSQVVCSGCRNVLIYPRGSNSVCCAFCNAITSILPPPPTPTMPNSSMDQLICGGCRTLLMYARGATSVRCSCCHTHNLAPPTHNLAPPTHNLAPPTPATYAHINCGNCRTTLMYPSGALSVKCSLCQYITNVNMNNGRVPIPMHQPGAAPPSGQMPSASTGLSHSQSQTVVVENPMSVDKSGKLVSNVVVGVTTEKK